VHHGRRAPRRMLLTSIVCLPLIFIALVLDRA
jgi:hypothetical protein